MVFNTATVGAAVTPAVIQTFITHYLNRKPLAQKPTAHISYDEGLHLIRRFLLYASHNTVEDIQRFTSQWVPHPHWVHVEEINIPEEYLEKSAGSLIEQLGHHGVEKVGGKTWWQWRKPGSSLRGEWIEMKTDYHERKNMRDPGNRVMLYVHGGAYFFGSVDEHRYQMQRHARKLKARVFAPRYRLAPQFPFPCGLQDCIAAYLYLLSEQDPSTILLAGDSAGGGMVLSMLVVLRDRDIPLPAGAILISPWVDLTHSFPSVAADNPLDYIPPYGFLQRPSASWPPPTAGEVLAMRGATVKNPAHKENVKPPERNEGDAIQSFQIVCPTDTRSQNSLGTVESATNEAHTVTTDIVTDTEHELSIMIDGKLVRIQDQIQMYTSNQLISHPLVSPILQPSLGGLPPLLILTGGGEMLRDEQIYLAHKAANPTKYIPGDAFLDDGPRNQNRDQISRWKPTDVQLQVWDDLCHVAPTLSFTRPAKYMYRSIAQFGAWALAKAQKTGIEILDDDDVSVISNPSSIDEDEVDERVIKGVPSASNNPKVGKAGDPLPPFKDHMIRQRVDRHGNISPLEPEEELTACNIARSEIGIIKEGPVRKWMAAKKQWDSKYASSKRRVQKQRAREIEKGYHGFGDGEVPPPSALAGRRTGNEIREEKKSKSMGMSLWALWGSKHDVKTNEREHKAGREPDFTVATPADGANSRDLNDTKTKQGKEMDALRLDQSRSRSRRRTVTDEGQADICDLDENTPALVLHRKLVERRGDPSHGDLTPNFATTPTTPSILIRSPTMERDEIELKRPKASGIAFPFSLKQDAETASMMTLTSDRGYQPVEDLMISESKDSGVEETHVDLAKGKEGGKKLINLKGEASEPSTSQGDTSERHLLATFATAKEDLPVIS